MLGRDKSAAIDIPGNGARAVVVIPDDRKTTMDNGVLESDGVPVDYAFR
ncbi:MAG: hypothetical protein M3Y57_21240 [Acidobacteriota bacterium]|nr:hypothetical protein [Acidobacteriota bacterium]